MNCKICGVPLHLEPLAVDEDLQCHSACIEMQQERESLPCNQKEPIMDLKLIITVAVNFLGAFASKTASTLDDSALAFLTALQQSPKLLDFFERLFGSGSDIPESAMPQIDPNDAELAAAIEESPEMKAFILRRRPPAELPEGSEEIVSLVPLIVQYLPLILALLKAWRDAKKATPTPPTT